MWDAGRPGDINRKQIALTIGRDVIDSAAARSNGSEG
jgi:hypothetical protein